MKTLLSTTCLISLIYFGTLSYEFSSTPLTTFAFQDSLRTLESPIGLVFSGPTKKIDIDRHRNWWDIIGYAAVDLYELANIDELGNNLSAFAIYVSYIEPEEKELNHKLPAAWVDNQVLRIRFEMDRRPNGTIENLIFWETIAATVPAVSDIVEGFWDRIGTLKKISYINDIKIEGTAYGVFMGPNDFDKFEVYILLNHDKELPSQSMFGQGGC